MRGAELQRQRTQRLTALRHAASLSGFNTGAFLALDAEELVRRASLDDQSAQGNAVKRRLLVGALRAANVGDALIAELWQTTPEMLTVAGSRPLLDRSGIADAIRRQVEEEMPETDEPGRVVPPEPTIAPAWARGERVAGS